MPQHNLFADLLGAIILPLFILLILAGMAGAKPDAILGGYFKLVGGLLQAILQLTVQFTGLILRELVKLIGQHQAARQKAVASSSQHQPAEKKPKVKIIVNED